MTEYIAADQVDELLGPEWAPAEQKARAVLMANAWLTDKLRGRVFDETPTEVVQAGAEVAREAAAGKLYQAVEKGVASKSVSADGVSSSKTYSATARKLTAGEAFAEALLAPWTRRQAVQMLKRI